MRSNRIVSLGVSLLASCLFASFASASTVEQFPADSTMAKIQKRGKLVVGSSLNTLMFSSRNPMTGDVEGFEADLARMLAKKLTGSEDNIEWVSTTPENRIPLVENKRVDMVIATMTVTDERKKVIGFAGPYYLAGQDSLVRADDDSIRKTADLDGKHPQAVGADGQDRDVQRCLGLRRGADRQAFRRVRRRRCDAGR